MGAARPRRVRARRARRRVDGRAAPAARPVRRRRARSAPRLMRDAVIEATSPDRLAAGPVWVGGFAFAPDGGRDPQWGSLPADAAGAARGCRWPGSGDETARDRERGLPGGRRRGRAARPRAGPARRAAGRPICRWSTPTRPAATRSRACCLARGATSGPSAEAARRVRAREVRQGGAGPRGAGRKRDARSTRRGVRRAALRLPELLLLLRRHARGGVRRREPRAARCGAQGAVVSTVALAGSTRRSADPAVDDHLGRAAAAQREGPRRARASSCGRSSVRSSRCRSGSRPQTSRPWSRSRTSSTWRRRCAPSWPSRAARSSSPARCTRPPPSAASRGSAAEPSCAARAARPRLVRRRRSAGWTPPRTASSASRCAARCSREARAHCYAGVGVVGGLRPRGRAGRDRGEAAGDRPGADRAMSGSPLA